MKKKFKQTLLRDNIFFDFIEDSSANLISNEKFIENLDLLVDNMKATSISGYDDTYAAIVGIRLKYVCRYMCKLNKDIERFINKDSERSLFNNMATTPKQYIDLSKYLLYPGIYYAKDKNDKKSYDEKYMVLSIKEDPKDNFIYELTKLAHIKLL